MGAHSGPDVQQQQTRPKGRKARRGCERAQATRPLPGLVLGHVRTQGLSQKCPKGTLMHVEVPWEWMGPSAEVEFLSFRVIAFTTPRLVKPEEAWVVPMLSFSELESLQD